jgi:putative SOS response-associated peptidase YedK
MAGLFDEWSNRDTGEVLNTFTIITTRANPMMEVIHNTMKRMPVILSADNEQRWLDITTEPVNSGIFEPFPQELMYSELLK